ncbi:MAG: AAA family ATPase [Dysgonamonadaceae bacterium]|jgi:predicted AAA+ superfamily ATPase|nr:AAA family ATPase [Dysgonamonadaceae bacterium]
MNYINRTIDKSLLEWKNEAERKPLLLRGARQVGKSSSVRELGKKFDYFLEINFEKKQNKKVKELFNTTSSPKTLCDELSLMYETPIVSGKTLLFLDEIQACIPAISSLRFFYEEMPDLHVISAGSLLEFALQEVPSFGVGRIRSLFMFPLSFDEFIRAMGANMLADRLQEATIENPLSEQTHAKCKELLLKHILIGGMPEVVSKYANGGTLLECQQTLDDLTLTFYDDFAKYKERVPVSRLREVFSSIIRQTGEKFTYSKASQSANHLQIKESVDLLELAGIVYPVTHTSANGLPLAAEQNIKYRKYLIFDTGIYQRFLKLDLSNFLNVNRLEQVNNGTLTELYAGLEMKKASSTHFPSELYYWQREKYGSEAEVDYVVQRESNIIPVEIKSGTKGTMQSMYRFISEKNSKYGIRCSMENFGQFQNIKIFPLYTADKIIKN